MAKQKILIVEDDKKIIEILRDYLELAEYNISSLNSGNKVVDEVKTYPPDFIILDIMLPEKDGVEICREIRTFSKVPILILTAKVEEIDRVLGLELGADDYICKPFSPREVVTRVKTILRRTNPDYETIEKKFIVGPITIDLESHNVIIGEGMLRFTPIEFNIIKLMASKPGKIFSRNDFISILQKSEDFNGSTRIIDSHIKNIRKKINEICPGNDSIQTVYGIGYLLDVPVTEK